MDELGEQKILRAVYSPRQLEEVLVDFWFNHFNVFAGKGPVRGYLTEYERDAIRPHVLGRFRDLLGAVAKSPAMLFYLDNWQSVDPQAAEDMTRRLDRRRRWQRRARPDRPSAPRAAHGREGHTRRDRADQAADAARPERELRARADGAAHARRRRRLHAGGRRRGRQGVHRLDDPRPAPGRRLRVRRAPAREGPEDRARDDDRSPAASGDGEAVLDLLAAHPSTATFIATKLARRFVADEPPPALVTRAAATFTQLARRPARRRPHDPDVAGVPRARRRGGRR